MTVEPDEVLTRQSSVFSHSDPELTDPVFLLGAGFSKPPGLPLATELLDKIVEAARSRWSVDGTIHLERDPERYEDYLADTGPRLGVYVEELGAWLD